MKLLVAWILNALALLLVASLVPDIHVANYVTALIAAVVIGLANILIKPILTIFTLPITILTLGLFIFVINGLLFYGVGHFLQGFQVATLKAGIIGAFAYSLISWLLSAIVIEKD
ncbi:MAG: phage holin family protein [Methylotenera sp.]|jgi:putative membrane protein|nr:phage holin family protein [Methylotenera sp.]